MASNIKVGDHVAYSARFLASTGQHTGAVPFMRGVVIDIEGTSWKLVTVRWDSQLTTRVHIGNLARVGTPEMSIN